MGNYLLVYHGGPTPGTPEEGAKAMTAWTDWFGALGEALVDGGNPAREVRTIGNNGSVSNGSLNPPSGYSIIRADDMDSAVALAKGSPVLDGGRGSIEVAEILPGM